MMILNYLLKGGVQYSNKVARETRISYSIVNKDIKKLVDIGLIEYKDEKINDKIKLIKITPKGMEVVLRLNKIQRLCK